MSYNRYKNTQKRKNYLLIHNKEKYDRVSIILPKGTKEKIKRLDINRKPYPLSRIGDLGCAYALLLPYFTSML